MMRPLVAASFTCAVLWFVPAQGDALDDCSAPFTEIDRIIAGCTALIEDPATPPGKAVDYHLKRAHTQVAAGDMKAAAADYAVVVEAIPWDPGALGEYGVVLMKLGRHREAIAAFDAALAQDEHGFFQNRLLDRGVAHCVLGDSRAAARDIAEAAPVFGPGFVARFAGFLDREGFPAETSGGAFTEAGVGEIARWAEGGCTGLIRELYFVESLPAEPQ